MTTKNLGILVLVTGALLVFGGTVISKLSKTNQSMDHTNNPLATQKKGGINFEVKFEHPPVISSKKPMPLTIKIFDKDSNKQVTSFDEIQEKLMHLIIVDNSLNNYQHLHPVFQNGEFVIDVTFPTNDNYHLYLDFQPTFADEQQKNLKLRIGENMPAKKSLVVDTNFKKRVGNYFVELTQGNFLLFHITTPDNKPVNFLDPYLGAYGHLVMIHGDTYEYVHIHPNELLTLGKKGGPGISFMPHSKLKPGLYKLFLQINPNEELLLSEFVIEIK